MAPRLFVAFHSSSVRAVLLTTKALNLNLELVEIDLDTQDQLKPTFTKMNPQHTVPTMVDSDEDLTIWDSHVINGYLVDKYGGFDDSLYPTDLNERTKVNMKLFFDTELATLTRRIVVRMLKGQLKSVDPEDAAEILDKYDILDKFLVGTVWICGTQPTIADFSLIATVTTADLIVPIDQKKFQRIGAWLRRAQQWPYYTSNKMGLDRLNKMIQEAIKM